MGAYVTRVDPASNKNRKYYKADDGKLYNDYNAAASVNMSPQARAQRFLGEKVEQAKGLLGNVRDNTVVPALDNAMESGIVPGKEGMYIRYLSGTEKPLTQMPADVRAAEAQVTQKKVTEQEKYSHMPSAGKTFKEWQDLSDSVKSKNQMFNMYGKGSPATQQEESRLQQLDSQVDAIADRLGVSIYDLPESLNYNDGTWSQTNQTVSGNAAYRSAVVPDTIEKTLGQYVVKDGIIEDRYDFNEFMKPGDKWTRDWNGEGVLQSGRAAHALGIIKPGSGYDVRFDTGRR
tara:strand:+ start:206 stop:1072 length:867 start_codon:yes stop_codon:yes gene_type:complete